MCNAVELAENLKNTESRIDIIKIANLLGIKVFSTKEISMPSFIAYDKETNSYEIYVNANEFRERQRFSIAHEIAHFIQHKEKIQEFGYVGRQNIYSLSAKEEKEADNLAGNILMPLNCIKKYLEENKIDENTKIEETSIKKIAKEFEVSLPVAAIRLRDMGYYVRYV